MIVGMPGCGKSLTAKCISKEFGVPLLRLDIGRLMGKYVGESEENLRKAIRVAEASGLDGLIVSAQKTPLSSW